MNKTLLLSASSFPLLIGLALTGLSLVACDDGSEGGGGGEGGLGGAASESGGASGTTGGTTGSGGGGSDECELPYNGCAVPALVREFAGTYPLTAEVVNSCGDLGFFVPSGTLTVTGTLTIDDEPVVRLELDDYDGTLSVGPEDEGFFPRDFSEPSGGNTGRWYAYANEGEANGLGYAEGFNLRLNEDLEFSNVEDSGQTYAVRVYTRNGCSIDFSIVE